MEQGTSAVRNRVSFRQNAEKRAESGSGFLFLCSIGQTAEKRKNGQDLHFAGNDTLLKQFIYKHGWDGFNFYDKLTKAQVIVFDYNDAKIEGREYLIKMIIAERHPIFEEDLAIDVNDIIEAGITDDVQRAQYLLSLLPEVIHKKPKKNERNELLKLAKQFNKSKLKTALRGVDWHR